MAAARAAGRVVTGGPRRQRSDGPRVAFTGARSRGQAADGRGGDRSPHPPRRGSFGGRRPPGPWRAPVARPRSRGPRGLCGVRGEGDQRATESSAMRRSAEAPRPAWAIEYVIHPNWRKETGLRTDLLTAALAEIASSGAATSTCGSRSRASWTTRSPRPSGWSGAATCCRCGGRCPTRESARP